MRDNDAANKVKGALLRLNKLQPEGFTADDLYRIVDAGKEAARDYLKPGRYDYVQNVGALKQPKGRPKALYRLTADGEARIISELVAMRRSATASIPFNEYPSLRQLESTLLDISKVVGSKRDELFAEAERELAAVEADHKILAREGGTDVELFGVQAGKLRWELHRYKENMREPPMPEPDVFEYEPLDQLVVKFGEWICRPSSGIHPPVLLFDATPGRDDAWRETASNWMRRDVPVASFDVTKLDATGRQWLFVNVAKVRATTPLVLSSLILCVNRAEKGFENLEAEFFRCTSMESWRASSPSYFREMVSPRVTREKYISILVHLYHSTDPLKQKQAKLVVAALSNLEASEIQSDSDGVLPLTGAPTPFAGQRICLFAPEHTAKLENGEMMTDGLGFLADAFG